MENRSHCQVKYGHPCKENCSRPTAHDRDLIGMSLNPSSAQHDVRGSVRFWGTEALIAVHSFHPLNRHSDICPEPTMNDRCNERHIVCGPSIASMQGTPLSSIVTRRCARHGSVKTIGPCPLDDGAARLRFGMESRPRLTMLNLMLKQRKTTSRGRRSRRHLIHWRL